MKTVHKVRAMVLDKKGRAYAIVADAPHVLQLPGGSRKPDECPIMAIRREIREELGYKIRIIGHAVTLKVKRNGTREITTCYVVMITGGNGKPKLTGREAARGLRVCRYPSPKALRKALRAREREYGRSAVARDHRLATAALATI